MTFSQIKETCLYVKDLHSTEKFYSEVLGLQKISAVENRHVFFRAGSSVLLFFNSDVTSVDDKLPPHFAKGRIHFALEVPADSYQQAKQELTGKGITIEHEHQWAEGVHSFYFRDPDGHLVEIVPEGMWD